MNPFMAFNQIMNNPQNLSNLDPKTLQQTMFQNLLQTMMERNTNQTNEMNRPKNDSFHWQPNSNNNWFSQPNGNWQGNNGTQPMNPQGYNGMPNGNWQGYNTAQPMNPQGYTYQSNGNWQGNNQAQTVNAQGFATMPNGAWQSGNQTYPMNASGYGGMQTGNWQGNNGPQTMSAPNNENGPQTMNAQNYENGPTGQGQANVNAQMRRGQQYNSANLQRQARNQRGFNRQSWGMGQGQEVQPVKEEQKEVSFASSSEDENDLQEMVTMQGVDVIHKKRMYRAAQPYPSLRVVKENQECAILLLDDYASAGSEFTAVMSYTYGSIILHEQYKEIQEAFLEISKVEMHHLHMLGEMIELLGIMPRFYAKTEGKVTMWNGKMALSAIEPKALLEGMLEGENMAIEQYKRHIDLVEDCYVKAALCRIVLDEEVHRQILLELQQSFFMSTQ